MTTVGMDGEAPDGGGGEVKLGVVDLDSFGGRQIKDQELEAESRADENFRVAGPESDTSRLTAHRGGIANDGMIGGVVNGEDV